MFKKVKSGKGTAGIGRYLNHQLTWEIGFLRGNVRVFEAHEKFGDPESFHAYVEPHLGTLEAIDTQPDLKHPKSLRPYYDDAARPHGIHVGPFAKLDDIEALVHGIEPFFLDVLSEKGAEGRILRPATAFNQFCLVPTANETAESFADALVAARDREVFVALKQGEHLPLEQIVGRVFRSLANALGVNYYLKQEHDDKTGDIRAVTFTYEGVGGFRFEDKGPDEPVALTRYSYGSSKQFGNGRDYFITFEGPATAENMQEKVFNWLIDAMMDISPERLQSEFDYDAFVQNRQRAADQFYGKMSETVGRRKTGTGVVLKLV